MRNVLSLRAFVALMEIGTVTGAAESIRRTQPQVSRLIAELEQEVGFRLFFRDRRRLVPTQRGGLLYAEVKRALNGLDEIDRIAEEIKTDSEAVLRILVPPYAAATVLPRALCKFRDHHPERRYTVEIVSRSAMGSWISFHPFDIGIASLPFELPSIRVRSFATVDTVVVMPKAHALAAKPIIDIRDLGRFPFIAMSRNTPLRRMLDETMLAAGVRANIIGETATSVSACEMVSQGLGITIVDALPPIVLDPGLVDIRPWKPGFRSLFGLIFPAAATQSNAANDFASILVETTFSMDERYVRPLKDDDRT
ncbi:putative LysR, transcriptional regulator (plasmid) [Ensifer adhaerens OV14]|nr:putative LysR, transcriptional regulator [Ensifer adhaerens OV14]